MIIRFLLTHPTFCLKENKFVRSDFHLKRDILFSNLTIEYAILCISLVQYVDLIIDICSYLYIHTVYIVLQFFGFESSKKV